jgi:hypothetical protein
MFRRFVLILFFFSFATIASFSQSGKNRIQPGIMYQEGESLYAPRLGFQASVPSGWVGNLPRESEVFLLMSSLPEIFGEIFVFGREEIDLNELAERWKVGENVTETIRLQAVSPTVGEDLLSSEVRVVGNNVNPEYRGFAASRCGGDGYCVTILAISNQKSYESVRDTALEFLTLAVFEEPSNVSPYVDFDWKAFLSNKLMISYTELRQGAKQTQINLCGNGAFNANVRKKGIMRDVNPQYKGNMRGKWSVEGIGPKAVLVLTFETKNLPPLRINLKIEEEQIYANEERYYASGSVKCN